MAIIYTYGKSDGINKYGYGNMEKFIDRGINASFGHSGRSVGYTANFFFPQQKCNTLLFSLTRVPIEIVI